MRTVGLALEAEGNVQKQNDNRKEREGQYGVHQHERAVHPQVVLIHRFFGI
jgi:hypothetical protein